MIGKIKNIVKRNAYNAKGIRVNGRIVVIESDDWGAIRTSSKKAYNELIKEGIPADKCGYMKYDALASETDLAALFDVLQEHKDKTGNHVKFTANTPVANPNFEKIRESNFEEYHYERFTDTLQRYPEHQNSFELWKQGIIENIFYPQSHGREHLNVSRWMRDLKAGNKETLCAFDLGVFGVSGHITNSKRASYLAAFDGGENELQYDRAKIVRDGLSMFQDIFGYKSKSFIAPNYVWGDDVEKAINEGGVRYIQGTNTQRLPHDYGKELKTKKHFLGDQNKYGSTYLIRNASFEPALKPGIDSVDYCLKEIANAFFWKKPAVISSHRVNYIGFIDESNRNKNLRQLDFLLKTILRKWPDVEFMSSDQLGELITR